MEQQATRSSEEKAKKSLQQQRVTAERKEEEGEDEESHSSSSVPTEHAANGFWPLVLYNRYWHVPSHAAKIMTLRDTLEARQDDVILATNPKCGTTWLKALAFTVVNRSRYGTSSVDHPLLTGRNPHELVPFMEIPIRTTTSTNEDEEDLTIITTNNDNVVVRRHSRLAEASRHPHALLALLPKSVAASINDTPSRESGHAGPRIVYVCREPKDAFVSLWHHDKSKYGGSAVVDLDDAFTMFCEGRSPMGPFWDHCLEYWRESVARPDRILFLRYEEMTVEPVKHVRKLAAFFGVPFTDEEETAGVPEEVARLFSFRVLSAAQADWSSGGFVIGDKDVISKSVFFREGEVGDWVLRRSGTQEMGRKLDTIVEEKLKGSGLVF